MKKGSGFMVTRLLVNGATCETCGQMARFSYRLLGSDVRYYCRTHLLARIERVTVMP